jgi:NADH/NAD ratio-sensing transcriptional regulator Rex
MQAVLRSGRTRLAALVASLAIAVGFTAVPAASAQQEGLVNVEISNVLNDNQVVVALPIDVAANVCGVEVNVLSAALGPDGPGFFTCDARGNQEVTITQRQ